MSKALGMIETRGLIASIEAADAMVKAADVRLINQEKVDAALVTILIEGDVSAVQAAIEAGKEAASSFGKVVSYLVIPHPDHETKELITRKSSLRKNNSTIDSDAIKREQEVKHPVDFEKETDDSNDNDET